MNAIVTGASSGIGLEIAKLLSEKGVKVYGIGRNFEKIYNDTMNFDKITVDLTDLKAIGNFYKNFREDGLDFLVNCAGVAYYGIHESIDVEKISEMVDVNIKAPMVMTKLFLPKIREAKGKIINISSVTAKSSKNTHGVCYGATKSALTNFGDSLFEEVRKQGVGVVNIHPDLTDTELYRNADFDVSGDKNSTLLAEEIAAAVIAACFTREGLCVTDITIRPQLNKIVKK